MAVFERKQIQSGGILMKKLISTSCFLLLPALALLAQGPRGEGPMGGRGMGMMAGPQHLVTGAPYSAVEVVQTQETLADGNTILHKRQSNVSRDSQGRVRMEETVTPPASSGKQPFTVTTILDYVGGHRYVLDSSTMTAYDSPLRAPRTPENSSSASERRGGAQAAVDRPNVVRTTLSPQSVNGVLASGIQHTETIPAGAIGNARAIQTTRLTWVSTELKVPVQIKSTDPRFGTTDMELTNIVQSEPSASLFVVPAGYTVKTGGAFGRGGGPGGMGPQMMRGLRTAPPVQQ
jgi:hypothetical protein